MLNSGKKYISIMLVAVLTILSSFVSFSEDLTNSYCPRTGVVIDEDNLLNLDKYIIDTPQTFAVLPTAVDNTAQFPTPGNQGDQGSCVAWAVGYALKSQQEVAKRNWTVNTNEHNFSPAYIYNSINKGSDVGLDIINTIKFLKNNGVCPLSYFPYDDSDCSTQPTSIQNAVASLYKTTNYGAVSSLTDIKTRIATGEGVVIVISVYPDFVNINNSNQIYDNVNGSYIGRHAICLIGYDDNKGSNGAFKFINSWGTNRQLNGYGWISYDLVSSNAVNAYGGGVGFVITVGATDNYILGDVDGDGTVTVADSRLILRFASSLESPTAKQYVLADANGDASVTPSDAQAVLQYASGLITQLPLYE